MTGSVLAPPNSGRSEVMLETVARVTATMARELAEAEGVCSRPQMRQVTDRDTGTVTRVALACGSTRENVCVGCARKARRLRMHQCAERLAPRRRIRTQPGTP